MAYQKISDDCIREGVSRASRASLGVRCFAPAPARCKTVFPASKFFTEIFRCGCDLARGARSIRIMPKNSRDAQKVELSGRGVSGFSQADVERRAGELALIDGRTAVTQEDRDAAVVEFRDRHLPDAVNEDAESMQSMSRDPSDPMVDRGRQIPEYGGEDEKAALEHLALEGVEEAQHEQMLESRNDIDEPFRSRPKRKQS